MPELDLSNAVRLAEVLDAFDMMNEEFSAYVNRKSGKVFPLHCDAFAGLEELESGNYGYPDEEMVAVAAEIESSGDFAQLPDSFEIHEWQIMKDFCETVDNESQRNQLLNAISAKGAFSRFKSAVDRLDWREDWFAFRHNALENLAIEWLDAHQFNWTRSRGANS